MQQHAGTSLDLAAGALQLLLKLHQRVLHACARQGTGKGCINLAAQGVALVNQSGALGAQPANGEQQDHTGSGHRRAQFTPGRRRHTHRIRAGQQVERCRRAQLLLQTHSGLCGWCGYQSGVGRQARLQGVNFASRRLQHPLLGCQRLQAVAQPEWQQRLLQQHRLLITGADQPARRLRPVQGLQAQPLTRRLVSVQRSQRQQRFNPQTSLGEAFGPTGYNAVFYNRSADAAIAASGPHDDVQVVQLLTQALFQCVGQRCSQGGGALAR